LNPANGQIETQALPIVSTRRQLVLNLNGGDAALFKFSTGAPFVGFFPPEAARLSLQMQTNVAAIRIQGTAGETYQLQRTASLPSNWFTFASVQLPATNHTVFDPRPPSVTRRFYRALTAP
jgi:hypothetical protein